ncbi:U-box domain-containing protein 5-like isoform X2 [Rhodamnia argentea]|uniref:RING-type E3 ubiquitin transferase n=1 Tax=Rhodamnia argentea TaxID=178133 RepID=A0A8B8NNB2_9MYRT|nr:U-box domain-containing protein 5-like isoform X2 [Rhodamnia argentea]
MGSGITVVAETLSNSYCFKVHYEMCTELMKLVDKVSSVIPQIEAARPRSSGMLALSSLICEIDKAKQLLHHCSESSKLYLALTSDAIARRCQRSRELLERGLDLVRNSVPVLLAIKICHIIDELRNAKFVLDSSEMEAGKVLRQSLRLHLSIAGPMETLDIGAIKFAASKLHIMSQRAVVTEKRSIKNLLSKVGDRNPAKKERLKSLLYLLDKYGNSIVAEPQENAVAHGDKTNEFQTSTSSSDAKADVLRDPVPPGEFNCPLSKRLMYDPIVIASGVTFERMWIQRWFDEGYDTCPKTKEKLSHQLLAPNSFLKHEISKWCVEYGVRNIDPSIRAETVCSLEASSTSIDSLGSLAHGYVDSIYNPDPSSVKVPDDLSSTSIQSDDDDQRCGTSIPRTLRSLALLPKLKELQWKSQCEVVEDVKNYLDRDDQALGSVPFENFLTLLVQFLVDAHDQGDLKAQRTGSQFLLTYVSKNRYEVTCIKKSAFSLLISLLDSEVSEQVLATLEVLSTHETCRPEIAASGVLAPIFKILGSQNRLLQESALKILSNLSYDCYVCHHLIHLGCIPKMVPFLQTSPFMTLALTILKNLCNSEEASTSIVETDECIASIAEFLDSASSEDQEYAVAILHSVCRDQDLYCKLVLDESFTVYPALINIKTNGSDKAKASASELLRLFRDIERDGL